MDLQQRAERAVLAVLDEAGMTTSDEVTVRLLKMAWFNGYNEGMEVTLALAEDAFAKLQEEVS